MTHRFETIVGGKPLSIETGAVARQADGAAWVRYGDTVVLVTAVAAKQAREGIDFFPLTVDYQERAYAAGKIPGGFFKREGRPRDAETLASRLIDRPIRPLFPKGYRRDVQIIATVLSADTENDPDVLAIVGASAALSLSPIPFLGPIGAVRVGRVGGQFILNPTYGQLERSDLDLVVAGTRDGVVMVEAGARETPEGVVLEAIAVGHKALADLCGIQEQLQQACGKPKTGFTRPTGDPALAERVAAVCREPIRALAADLAKEDRADRLAEIRERTVAGFTGEPPEVLGEVRELVETIEKEEMRRLLLTRGIRTDGRSPDAIRPIRIAVGLLPRTHGSALFTRGETQALVTTTLGTSEDVQRLDSIEGEGFKRFMLHYNFPPFSVGEVRFLRGPGRREIGHGALAERALLTILPAPDEFPYTLRIVSDILESNGSSSMATVCGASLALMDAGVPIRAAVGGVAMGLVKEGDKVVILTDILGLEDHLGDMDFKVAGTRRGLTALQMDIKIVGVTAALMGEALERARAARLHVLDQMDKVLAHHRDHISPYAPRIITFKIPVDKIREVIGPGGKMIRSIIEETGVKIDISDDGTVEIASADEAAAAKALGIVHKIIEVPEVGKTYTGKVKKITDFGAFVEILPGTDGLLHISQIAETRIVRVEDVLKEGQEVTVKVIEIDRAGKVRLSRKEVLRDQQQREKR
ncbi:MAG TPA: polyribonucleotide nucleotidyltransferase [Candidatus Methylomirabilis sp.]|nr:polyribonucleotide nucleotidyltransferase [Candidatus Methylomirabilis sp.]